MKFIRRTIYLGYYLMNLDWKVFFQFLKEVKVLKKKASYSISLDVISSIYRYNISILDYFYFQFFDISAEERQKYAGTGYMYEYQLKMNPKETRNTMIDKRIFYQVFKGLIQHELADYATFESDKVIREKLLQNISGKLILKKHDGQCGMGIELIGTESIPDIKERINATDNDLIEEFIIQHPLLMELSPSGLNTVRIITQLNPNNQVDILGCRLRITVNSIVDNMAAGNIAAPIDVYTGKVTGPAVYSSILKKHEYYHPITKVKIVDFQIPHWKETILLATRAALQYKECRSIGWDIAITKKGPDLLEGNHDWCKLLWQLPVKRGLKMDLEKYL